MAIFSRFGFLLTVFNKLLILLAYYDHLINLQHYEYASVLLVINVLVDVITAYVFVNLLVFL